MFLHWFEYRIKIFSPLNVVAQLLARLVLANWLMPLGLQPLDTLVRVVLLFFHLSIEARNSVSAPVLLRVLFIGN